MLTNTILVVEDEKAIRDMIKVVLTKAGYTVLTAGSSEEALVSIADLGPDLILLDWMMPGSSGIELARRLKNGELNKDIPIMMLTARSEEDDKIKGFEVGVDDYITKPFSPRELVARIKALLRRTSPVPDNEIIEIDGLSMDLQGHRVNVYGRALELGPTEYKLLKFFMTHPERVYSRTQLLDRVWGGNIYIEERTVDVHIRRLRKALEESGHAKMIQTVRGSGYRLSTKE